MYKYIRPSLLLYSDINPCKATKIFKPMKSIENDSRVRDSQTNPTMSGLKLFLGLSFSNRPCNVWPWNYPPANSSMATRCGIGLRMMDR